MHFYRFLFRPACWPPFPRIASKRILFFWRESVESISDLEHRFFRPLLSKETSLAAFLRFSIPLLPYARRTIHAEFQLRAARFQAAGVHSSVAGISLVVLAFSGHFARAKCSRNLAHPPLVLNGPLIQRAPPSIRVPSWIPPTPSQCW